MMHGKRLFKLPAFAAPIGPRALAAKPLGPLDPSEPWELPADEAEDRPFLRGAHEVFPHTPRRPEDLPSGALESLQAVCGVEGLHQLFIVPRTVRFVGWKDQKVMSPNGVLALGRRAVGLWTDAPEPGVKVAVGLERLSGIQSVTILLYGRLTFFGAGQRLTIRYNTVARSRIEPALLELRARLAGSPQAVPQEHRGAEDLPFKWRQILSSASARLWEGAPSAFRFSVTPGRVRHDIERGQLLVLNPHELVYLCDPLDASHHYGEDSFILPRSRIGAVRIRRDCLKLISNGSQVSLSMGSELCQTAARWLT